MVKRNAFAGGLGIARCDDARALRAALANDGANPRDPRFVLQKFIAGEVYSVAISGVCGKAAAAFSFIKKVNTRAHGQACILQYARREDLIEHARGLFEALRLNGYAGVDYIVDRDGRAYLLEINQCLVMKSHFSDCFGVDLTAAMLALHRGQSIPAPRPPTHEYVALFPSEWARDPASPQLYHAYHDVPWEDPALLSGMIASFHAQRTAGARKQAVKAQTLAD
jgi:biotin carboxylase